MLLQLAILSGVMAVPITFAVVALVRYLVGGGE